jgi:hypothetical protein
MGEGEGVLRSVKYGKAEYRRSSPALTKKVMSRKKKEAKMRKNVAVRLRYAKIAFFLSIAFVCRKTSVQYPPSSYFLPHVSAPESSLSCMGESGFNPAMRWVSVASS